MRALAVVGSLRYDREVKPPLYAEAGVPEAWLVDLVSRQLEVHREPRPDGYRQITLARAGDTVAPAALSDATVEVASLFGWVGQGQALASPEG